MYVYLQKIEWINIVIKKVVYICSFVFFCAAISENRNSGRVYSCCSQSVVFSLVDHFGV